MSHKLRDSTWDKDKVIEKMLSDIEIPKMSKILQKFKDDKLKDIPQAIHNELNQKKFQNRLINGNKIAITVGSRGIANISLIVHSLVDEIKKLGGDPFIIPAMGSHGGATADGQRDVLKGLGITEKSIGASIKSSMEVKEIGKTSDGKSVYVDKFALEADGIIVLGRIKPHTAFRGKYESGLFKMMSIGLGKQKGAEICHAEGFGNMAINVPAFAKVILNNTNILFGMGIIENAFDDTYKIIAMTKDEIPKKEPKLLIEAKELMPKIMFDEFDVLIIDKIGKNFSGDGMDPNITATYCTPYASGGPQVQRYVVLDLSHETHGNTIGVGMADFTTKRLFDKTDFDQMYPNSLTCTVTLGAKMPIVLNSDKLAISAAIYTCNSIDKNKVKIVRIKNTSHISEIYISEALVEQAKSNKNIKILTKPRKFNFNDEGNLI